MFEECEMDARGDWCGWVGCLVGMNGEHDMDGLVSGMDRWGGGRI
jgi:hypothetical protein